MCGWLTLGPAKILPRTAFTSVPPCFLQGPVGPAGGPGFPGAPGAKVSALVGESGTPFPHNLCCLAAGRSPLSSEECLPPPPAAALQGEEPGILQSRHLEGKGRWKDKELGVLRLQLQRWGGIGDLRGS